jgi:hypothetical protein
VKQREKARVTHRLESMERVINKDSEESKQVIDTHILERAKPGQVRVPKKK